MYIAIALLAGAGLAFQAVINSRLRAELGSPVWAAIAQGVVGFGLLGVMALVVRPSAPALAGLSRLPWWIWTGGLLGTTYVVAAIVATPPLGAALLVALIIVGQTAAALLIDHYGWFGVKVSSLTPIRTVGAALLVAGVLLIRYR